MSDWKCGIVLMVGSKEQTIEVIAYSCIDLNDALVYFLPVMENWRRQIKSVHIYQALERKEDDI